MMAGTPQRNKLCSVLWWNTRIPQNTPTEPPSAAVSISVRSRMRQRSCFALYLSIPIIAKPAIFMMIK